MQKYSAASVKAFNPSFQSIDNRFVVKKCCQLSSSNPNKWKCDGAKSGLQHNMVRKHSPFKLYQSFWKLAFSLALHVAMTGWPQGLGKLEIDSFSKIQLDGMCIYLEAHRVLGARVNSPNQNPKFVQETNRKLKTSILHLKS